MCKFSDQMEKVKIFPIKSDELERWRFPDKSKKYPFTNFSKARCKKKGGVKKVGVKVGVEKRIQKCV